MKKLLILFSLLVLFTLLSTRTSHADVLGLLSNVATTTGRDITNTLPANGATWYVFTYYTTGGPASAQVRLDADLDGNGTWQTCTTTETGTATGTNACWGVYSRVAINIIALSGGTSPVIHWTMLSYNIPPDGTTQQYSPALLGISGASVLTTASVLSNKIDLRGAKSITFEGTCNQTFNIGIETFDDSGSVAFQDYVLFTGGLASSNFTVTANTGLAPTAVQGTGATPTTNGTAMTSGAGVFALPQRTIKLYITNTSISTATCTAKALVQY